jgi:hypothetical protein
MKIEKLSLYETLRRIVHDKVTIARFGDGDCRQAYFQKAQVYQPWTPLLRDRLRQVLVEPKPGVLPCFNHHYRRHALIEWVADYERYPKKYAFRRSRRAPDDVGVLWRPRDVIAYHYYWSRIRLETHQPVFGDACVFFMGLYVDEYAEGRFEEVRELFRSLFSERRILFVASDSPLGGASFREEMDKLKSIGLRGADILTIPSTDAFAHYDQILAEIRRRDFDDVFIQAGPTATIAAYDLAGTIKGRIIDAGSLNTQIRYLPGAAAAEVQLAGAPA